MFESQRRVVDRGHILSGIERCIMDEDNAFLTTTYKAEEVCQALKAMGPTKALGMDVFPTIFFQKF